MKKLIASTIVSAVIILFSFQNCQKTPNPDEINPVNLSTKGISEKIDLNQEVLNSVTFLIPDTKIVKKAGNSYQINYSKNLMIDLKTGVILESSDLESKSSRYCLTEPMKNELLSILKSAHICKALPVLPEDAVCTQVMRLPYAVLITSREQFDLGAASDGCGSNGVDLCDEFPAMLKGYIESIKNQYQQLECK